MQGPDRVIEALLYRNNPSMAISGLGPTAATQARPLRNTGVSERRYLAIGHADIGKASSKAGREASKKCIAHHRSTCKRSPWVAKPTPCKDATPPRIPFGYGRWLKLSIFVDICH